MPISRKLQTTEPRKHYGNTSRVDTQNLLERLLEYESKLARTKRPPISPTERDVLRAELMCDFVYFAELVINGGTLGKSKGIATFVRKLAQLAIPSHELLGTYLAAINVLYERHPELTAKVINDAARNTMIYVLGACTQGLEKNSPSTARTAPNKSVTSVAAA